MRKGGSLQVRAWRALPGPPCCPGSFRSRHSRECLATRRVAFPIREHRVKPGKLSRGGRHRSFRGGLKSRSRNSPGECATRHPGNASVGSPLLTASVKTHGNPAASASRTLFCSPRAVSSGATETALFQRCSRTSGTVPVTSIPVLHWLSRRIGSVGRAPTMVKIASGLERGRAARPVPQTRAHLRRSVRSPSPRRTPRAAPPPGRHRPKAFDVDTVSDRRAPVLPGPARQSVSRSRSLTTSVLRAWRVALASNAPRQRASRRYTQRMGAQRCVRAPPTFPNPHPPCRVPAGAWRETVRGRTAPCRSSTPGPRLAEWHAEIRPIRHSIRSIEETVRQRTRSGEVQRGPEITSHRRRAKDTHSMPMSRSRWASAASPSSCTSETTWSFTRGAECAQCERRARGRRDSEHTADGA
jgi:hypothetical protein